MLKIQMIDFLKRQAVEPDDNKIAATFTHLLVKSGSLEAVKYDEENGIASFLDYLVRDGWEGMYENDDIVGVFKNDVSIVLKAGGQLEFYSGKMDDVQQIDKVYLEFLKEVFDELAERKQVLLTVGYQPVTEAAAIEVVPMEKYKALLEYYKDDKKMTEWLKAGANMSVIIDYAHSDDFEKKYRCAAFVAPILAAVFDNVAMWGSKEYDGVCGSMALRNSDNKALSYMPNVLSEGAYKFDEYVQTLCKMPAVAVADGETVQYVGAQTNQDAFADKVSDDQIIGVLNMCQADVRATERGIEITTVDSLPYPLNMACVALIKGLFYNREQLDALYEFIGGYKQLDLDNLKLDILQSGYDTKIGEGTLHEMIRDLLFMAQPTLQPNEQHYLQPLDAIVFKNIRPQAVTKKQLKAMRG